MCVLQTLMKSTSKKALIIFHLCCIYFTVALQQLLQPYFFFFFFPTKCCKLGILKLKSLAFSMAGRSLVTPTGMWKEYIFIFWRNTLWDRLRVQNYIVIHNRYSKMRNFCTTMATSVSERISMVTWIGQCVLF